MQINDQLTHDQQSKKWAVKTKETTMFKTKKYIVIGRSRNISIAKLLFLLFSQPVVLIFVLHDCWSWVSWSLICMFLPTTSRLQLFVVNFMLLRLCCSLPLNYPVVWLWVSNNHMVHVCISVYRLLQDWVACTWQGHGAQGKLIQYWAERVRCGMIASIGILFESNFNTVVHNT